MQLVVSPSCKSTVLLECTQNSVVASALWLEGGIHKIKYDIKVVCPIETDRIKTQMQDIQKQIKKLLFELAQKRKELNKNIG
eukprot:270979-Ditylum_brightwellii.AAC.1